MKLTYSEPIRKCAKNQTRVKTTENRGFTRFDRGLKDQKMGASKPKPSFSKAEVLSKPLVLWPVCVAHSRIAKPSFSKAEVLSKPLVLWPVCVAHFRIV